LSSFALAASRVEVKQKHDHWEGLTARKKSLNAADSHHYVYCTALVECEGVTEQDKASHTKMSHYFSVHYINCL
jgi:hypothetical protein